MYISDPHLWRSLSLCLYVSLFYQCPLANGLQDLRYWMPCATAAAMARVSDEAFGACSNGGLVLVAGNKIQEVESWQSPRVECKAIWTGGEKPRTYLGMGEAEDVGVEMNKFIYMGRPSMGCRCLQAISELLRGSSVLKVSLEEHVFSE